MSGACVFGVRSCERSEARSSAMFTAETSGAPVDEAA